MAATSWKARLSRARSWPIEKDIANIDDGLKTEGLVSVKEIGEEEGRDPIKVGDTVEVFLERVENAMGEAVLSRDKARREEAWTRLEAVYERNEPVMKPSSAA